jgi:anthranilate synthase component 2
MKKHQPKILVIDNYDSFTYNLIQMLEEHGGCTFDVVRNDQIQYQSVEMYQKVLISPGPGLPAQAGKVCEFIKRFAASISILGICLGHQAIAEVFGGTLINLSDVSHGVTKRIHWSGENDYLFTGVPLSFNAGLYHSWVVARDVIPDSLRITAWSSDKMIMALAHKKFDIRGIQFHPESIMTEVGKTIIANWINHAK